MNHFGERLRKLRKERGLTLQEVGDQFDIQRASVSEWESGRTYPDARRLTKLAQILNTSVEYLLNGNDTAAWPLHPIPRSRITRLSATQLDELRTAISVALSLIEARADRNTPPQKTGTKDPR